MGALTVRLEPPRDSNREARAKPCCVPVPPVGPSLGPPPTEGHTSPPAGNVKDRRPAPETRSEASGVAASERRRAEPRCSCGARVWRPPRWSPEPLRRHGV